MTMLQFCFFAMVLSGSVLDIDPPEFVVEEAGEYIISAGLYAYSSDVWIDGYLIVNGKSIDSFHGISSSEI